MTQNTENGFSSAYRTAARPVSDSVTRRPRLATWVRRGNTAVSSSPPVAKRSPSILLAYSATEKPMAERIHNALRAQGHSNIRRLPNISSVLDSAEIISHHVKDASTVISIISSESLMNNMVGIQTIRAVHNQPVRSRPKLIGCALDRSFLGPAFRTSLKAHLWREILTRNRAILKLRRSGNDFSNAALEKEQLEDLWRDVSTIHQQLRDNYRIRIDDANFESIFGRILGSLA